ncbi:MAG: hypothetical protein ABJ360_24510 [Roseobacter sp.]
MKEITSKAPGVYGTTGTKGTVSVDLTGGIRGSNGVVSVSSNNAVDLKTGETKAVGEFGVSIGLA